MRILRFVTSVSPGRLIDIDILTDIRNNARSSWRRPSRVRAVHWYEQLRRLAVPCHAKWVEFSSIDPSNVYSISILHTSITWEITNHTKWQDYAINHSLTPFINCQNLYNLLYREEDREMMPLLKHLGVGSTPWSPVAKGRKFWLPRLLTDVEIICC